MANLDKKTKGLGLPETKGTFEIRGIVTGTDRDQFYIEKPTKNNKPFRNVNFGIKFDTNSTTYISLNGMEQERVYCSKSIVVDGKKKAETISVPWKDRLNKIPEDYRLIGVHVGLKQGVDGKGSIVNEGITCTPYDACKEINENLKDDQSVFVRGNITYSTYEGKRQVRFEPQQISLCKKPIDFEASDFTSHGFFTQTIVFMGIAPNEGKSKFIVSAKIVGYNSVEEAEFIIKNKALAQQFKTGLKPNWSISVHGNIEVEQPVDEVEIDDGWGESNNMKRLNAPFVRELVITGADPSTIEKEVYSEVNIEAAIEKAASIKQAKNDFGDKESNWGAGVTLNDEGEEEDW